MQSPRLATTADASVVATLLDAFNREFDTPTPGIDILTDRLTVLLAGDGMFALLAGEPVVGVALVSIRANVWYPGPVTLLDELYVTPEQRNGGHGTALLKAVEAEANRRGSEVLEINVDGGDTDTRRFYERHGYTNIEDGETEPMYFYYREFTASDFAEGSSE